MENVILRNICKISFSKFWAVSRVSGCTFFGSLSAYVLFGTNRMQICKKKLNQLKNFLITFLRILLGIFLLVNLIKLWGGRRSHTRQQQQMYWIVYCDAAASNVVRFSCFPLTGSPQYWPSDEELSRPPTHDPSVPRNSNADYREGTLRTLLTVSILPVHSCTP